MWILRTIDGETAVGDREGAGLEKAAGRSAATTDAKVGRGLGFGDPGGLLFCARFVQGGPNLASDFTRKTSYLASGVRRATPSTAAMSLPGR